MTVTTKTSCLNTKKSTVDHKKSLPINGHMQRFPEIKKGALTKGGSKNIQNGERWFGR